LRYGLGADALDKTEKIRLKSGTNEVHRELANYFRSLAKGEELPGPATSGATP